MSDELEAVITAIPGPRSRELALRLAAVEPPGVTYLGQRYANNTDSTVVPQYWRLDATAAYKQPTYDIRLNVFNLANTTNYEQVVASDGGRVVPGTGLTAMLSYVHHM